MPKRRRRTTNGSNVSRVFLAAQLSVGRDDYVRRLRGKSWEGDHVLGVAAGGKDTLGNLRSLPPKVNKGRKRRSQ